MSIESLLKEYRDLPEVDDRDTAAFAEAIKFQRLHDTGDVIPMSSFIRGLGSRFTDEKGFGIYFNKIGLATADGPAQGGNRFIPCLHPSYFSEFEGKEAAERYPYVLWFERKDK